MVDAGGLGLLCVHAHPDDESIATGGVLARYAEEGIRTGVVTCTGGELGEIVGPGMDPDAVRPHLAEVRAGELRDALRILGAGEPRFLGYRDSGMIGTPGNDDERSFWRAPFDEAVGRLVREIRAFRPDVLVVYDAVGGYGHPDHIQVHRVGIVAAEAAACQPLYPDAGRAWKVRKTYAATFPRSFLQRFREEMDARDLDAPVPDVPADELAFGTPDEEISASVDVRPWLDRKWQALRAHVSQLGEESFFLNVPSDLRELAFGREWFLLLRSSVAAAPAEDDLFAGLR